MGLRLRLITSLGMLSLISCSADILQV